MINYTKEQLKSMLEKVQQEYDGFVKEGLKLDMSRGKPSPDQLSLSNDISMFVLINIVICLSSSFKSTNSI